MGTAKDGQGEAQPGGGIRCRGLNHRVQGATILDRVDLDVARGELVALVGPSGVGKTTLLHLIAGILPLTQGRLSVAGRQLPGRSAAARARLRRSALTLVPQGAWLVQRISSLDNACLPGWIAGTDDGQARARARRELAGLQCEALADEDGRRLSAGERARVVLARGLVSTTPVLLADEPTGNLDRETAERVTRRLGEAARLEGRAVLVATHDEMLIEAADRVLELRDGRLVGPEPSEVSSPDVVAPEPGTARGAVRLLRWPVVAWKLSRGQRIRELLACAAFALLTGAILLLLGLLSGVETTLTERVLGRAPVGTLRVEESRVALGPLEMELGGLLTSRLDDDVRDEIEDLPGVVQVHPQRYSSFPLTLSGRFMDLSMATDAVLEGLEADWLADDVDPDLFQWDPDEADEPIPAVVSEALVGMANAGILRSQGLPRVRPQQLVGLSLKGQLGRSSFVRTRASETVRVKFEIVGLSNRVSPVALAVPMSAVEHYARHFAGDEEDALAEALAYSSLVIELEDLRDAAAVVEGVEDMGLRVDKGDGLASHVARAFGFLGGVWKVAGGALLLLFLAMYAQLTAAQLQLRRRDIDLLQSLGATPRGVLGLVTLWTLPATVLGIAIGALGAAVAGHAVAGWLADWVHDELGLRTGPLFDMDLASAALVVLVLPILGLAMALLPTLRWLARPLDFRLRD